MKRTSLVFLAAIVSAPMLGGCATASEPASEPASSAHGAPATAGSIPASATASAGAGLSGSAWRLVGFQSMDDAQGTTTPGEGRTYTLEFRDDGAIAMQLDCNRGRATWSAVPTSSDGGQLTVGPAISTRALCPQPDMGEMLARRISEVSSYTLRDGHLFLALKMDGGIFEFAPL